MKSNYTMKCIKTWYIRN